MLATKMAVCKPLYYVIGTGGLHLDLILFKKKARQILSL